MTWHPDALADVARLHQFLSQSSPAAARRGAAAIIKAANKIIRTPHLGTPCAEFREWPAKFGKRAYVLRYFILDNGDVLITRVWHSREQKPI
ncbi:type II toxin-antitoxin system RelE/ParE family toxin [Duganella radicis]|uniref:Type II toxin-antitoxin system RelE/ParE family toxin n=1 Tax=Duganella radicis TaxID=551988 RepID=A0A6L6PIQ6_9BURK|nr:type II toxin-antitoxin system RelE/ParE family toxin [Duganella radicis]